MGKKKNVILPPQLPQETADEDIIISDEDVNFVKKNKKYANLLKNLDTKSIDKQVSRVAAGSKTLEDLHEEKIRKRNHQETKGNENGIQVEPGNDLPFKTLDGQLKYRLPVTKKSKFKINEDKDEGCEDGNDKEGVSSGFVKLTKAERRAKQKKIRKEEKQQARDAVIITENVQENSQAEVLAELKEELSVVEQFEAKKIKLAELGMTLLEDPESNIKLLNEIVVISKDEDYDVVKLGLLSLLAVFKDIIPGYRIRLPTEKEEQMKVSKAVYKTRVYEKTLLLTYKAYLQRLISLEKKVAFQHVAVRCICTLLEAVPHFNYRGNLLAAVVKQISSTDDAIRKLCCSALKSLFTNEGKHGGEATLEAVQLVAGLVKLHNCQLHPDSIEVFMYLSFADDLGKSEIKDVKKVKYNAKRKRKEYEEQKKLQANEKRKSKMEQLEKTREEVEADFKAATFAPDVMERRSMQSETLSAVFQTYFRVLMHTVQSATSKSKSNTSSFSNRFGAYPLLAPCLNGLGKFSHLLDIDFMGDLMKCFKKLASAENNSDGPAETSFTVSERLRCCIIAFKVMRNNLDALNVDLHEFFVQLYNLLLEYRPDRDQGEVLAEALKIMLCEGRQQDMQRAAAFIKRLATFSLSFGPAEAMAALVTLRDLLQKNVKCRNLLENDAGGGSLSGSVSKYQPCASDPNQSGALASVLWELSLLRKHYHPVISSAASAIASIGTALNQVYLTTTTPQQAFKDLSIEHEVFNAKGNLGMSNKKRRNTVVSAVGTNDPVTLYKGDEDNLIKRFSEHYTVIRDNREETKLRRELNRTVSSLNLYEKFKKQKKKRENGTRRECVENEYL